ncbi:M13 family metallopeptidase [Sphingomonas bacterium]|uniref:M13 family metallopeptidase n=1 Tax=Sphingomonas bacterium TaxID=1895847 RepID=UPI001576EC88|nr:M13 family metallopeptidase [Sphingomonas bacterium]
MKRTIALATLLAATSASAQTMPAGIDRTAIDAKVKPGDDFEQYANGAWRAQAVIPPDRASIGAFLTTAMLSEQRNAQIIAEATAADAAPGTETRKIADYYTAYMDTAGIEARGLAPLKGEFAAIAALEDKRDLSRMLGANVRADVDPLNVDNFHTPNIIGLFVSQSLDAPTVTVSYVLQGGLGLGDRDYYLSKDASMVEIRQAYQAYVAKLLTLSGFADADARAAAIVALETKIATVHESLVDSQDVHKADNPWKRADFAAKAPGIDWSVFWPAVGLGKQVDFVAWQPAAITGLSALVASEPLSVWQDWLRFHRVDAVTSVLPAAFYDASFAFYGKMVNGAQVPRPREKRAIGAVNGALGDAVGRLYVKQYFPASSKADIQAMVKDILAAFDARVVALDWMAPSTKAEARAKIEGTVVGIGYPETFADYTQLTVRADDPVGNMERAGIAQTKRQLAKIGRPVDRHEWWMTPQLVNAVNLPLQNALNFPAAILEVPFYDPHRDAAANYGAIGAVIGHEISHGFDNTGADFDSTGRLRNWWTPADLARFDAQGKRLVAQYDAYEPLPGLHVNGQQTLGENIADVAGLTAAVDAYHASLGGKPAPVIDGMTGDQRLFLAFAQVWQSKARDKALRAGIATDGHAPARYRAETVRNLDAWYDAFGVKPGDALYLPADQRVHIW